MKKFTESLQAYFIFIIIAILIVFSSKAKQGAIQGINLCEGIIIPALLPVLILSSTAVKLKPSNSFAAVFFGLISGYPSGAVLTRELYQSKSISENEAKRLMCFNFCGGFAFIISAVGTVVYRSTKTGVILYLSSALSSLIIALITKPFYKKERAIQKMPEKINPADAFCESAESSVKSLAVMSAYIILFSALLSIIPLPENLTALFEITNGICTAKKLLPLPICAFYLAFGGLCIHFQLISFLKNMKISYFVFLIYRLLGASLSYFICKIFLIFFPETAVTSAALSPALPFEISKLGSGLSAVMIVGCAVIVFDLENRKAAHG
ncbi:MAG: hypothetical protein IKN26_05905 [Eubacterium sp.]|nr:hypothetical protein [Eubacterium sp.]MBR4241012.1 hypothetical protein [Eubacterium sp.]